MKIKMVITVIIVAIAGVITFFIIYLTYESRTDVSADPQLSLYINTPLEMKDKASITWHADKYSYRFKPYQLEYGFDSVYNEPTRKTVKVFRAGDKIVFHQAMRYKSVHVGSTYYFIGKVTLQSGEEVEFEYFYSSTTQPALWETTEEFVQRRQREREAVTL